MQKGWYSLFSKWQIFEKTCHIWKEIYFQYVTKISDRLDHFVARREFSCKWDIGKGLTQIKEFISEWYIWFYDLLWQFYLFIKKLKQKEKFRLYTKIFSRPLKYLQIFETWTLFDIFKILDQRSLVTLKNFFSKFFYACKDWIT